MKNASKKPRQIKANIRMAIFNDVTHLPIRLCEHGEPLLKMRSAFDSIPDYRPVAILELTPESYDQMVEQMAHADVVRGGQSDDQYDLYMDLTRPRMRRLLRSIGIAKPKKS